jgi:septum formation protein
MTTPPRILLASSSVYRRELLDRLLPSFDCESPGIDETRIDAEAPIELATRLADLKARAGAAAHPGHIVIGADQVPTLNGEILRKPGGRERAIAQLSECAGHSVIFWTAVTVLGPDGQASDHVDRTIVTFRALTREAIERYVDAEQPYDSAGAFKVEGLGISLFEKIESQDPTALQGLPLIWLAACLNRCGITLP